MSSPPSPEPGSLLLLLAAVAILGVGPLLFLLSRRVRWLLPIVDGFVLASVGALAALYVLPAAIAQAGPWALLAAGAGLLVPTSFEHVSTRHRLVHGVGIALALVGLLAHTITDGVALVTTEPGDYALALAVVLHRIPVGLAAWWIVRPLYGVTGAWTVLALEGAGTVVGFLLGDSELLVLHGAGLGLFQAFVAGALLHVVVHRTTGAAQDDRGSARWRVEETAGAVLGAALVALVPHRHEPHGGEVDHAVHPERLVETYAERFLDLAVDAAPWLLVGYLLAGVLVVTLPRAPLDRLAGHNALSRAARGVAYGIPLPICSCGVVAHYEALVRRDVPGSSALAFLVSRPQLGVESLLISLPLLGASLTGARLIAAVMLALLLGATMGARLRAAPGHGDAGEVGEVGEGDEGVEAGSSARRALAFGLREVVDDTAGWILLGLAVAAAIEPAALEGFMTRVPTGTDVVVATLLGMPLYVCAAGATPLAAGLLFAGMSPGAAVAFLLSGPATNVSIFTVLSRLHGRRGALLVSVGVLGVAIGAGLLVNALLPAASPPAFARESADAGVFAWAALVTLAFAYAAALLRQGPRRFLGGVLSFGQVSAHDHDHDHDHEHDHHHHHHHLDPVHHPHAHEPHES